MVGLVDMQSEGNSYVDIFFVDDPTDPDPSDWRRAFGDSAWFAEKLPNKFPVARKYVFACRPPCVENSPVNIKDAARSLLLQWARLDVALTRNIPNIPSNESGRRRNRIDRPVVFVCQSIGGLVVQKALLLTESEGGNPALVRRIFGAVFIGTPHPGELNKFFEMPNSTEGYIQNQGAPRAARLTREEPEQIHRPLAQGGDTFQRACPVYSSINFCLGTTSICSGASEVHQTCLWSIISEPQMLQHEEYHYALSATLDPIVARTSVEHAIGFLSDAASRNHQSFYQCLESEESTREMYAKDRARGTCDWLFSLEWYDHWVSAKGTPLLWISGSPGTGKSTLCSAIINDLWKCKENEDIIAFSFLEGSWDRPDVAQYILKTLTYQLIGHQVVGNHECSPHAIIREMEGKPVPMSRDDFQLTLRRLLASVEVETPVFLIIDGIDGDEWIKIVFITEIGEANRTGKTKNRFRCAIATRDLFEGMGISNVFQARFLNLDKEPGVLHDLKMFTDGRLAELAGGYELNNISTASLAMRLYHRANGVFLWAALAIERLYRMIHFADLARAIELIPAEIDRIYQEDLRSIPSHNVNAVQKIFSWLAVADCPLRLSEVDEVLTVEMNLSHPPVQEAEHVAQSMRQSSQEDVISLCGGLVRLAESGVVRLRHSSLRAFLLSAQHSSRPRRSPGLEAHELLARTCLVLLILAGKNKTSSFGVSFSSWRTAEMKSPLTNYAASNWLRHYRLAETHSKILAGALQRYLGLFLDCACEYLKVSPTQQSVQIANTILRISTSHGLVSLTQMCLEMGTDPQGGSCNLCKTPFALAIEGGHLGAANVLLKQIIPSFTSTQYDTNDMLHLAVASGVPDIVKTLLRHGAKVDCVDPGSGQTSLHNAAASGDWDLVSLLMDHNADVNAVIPVTLETPLHLAAVNGHLQVVRYLVHGRDASPKEVEIYDSIVQQPFYQSWTDNLLSEDGETATLISGVGARDSAEDLLEKLLFWSGRYSNINMRNAQALTALDLAASRGHESIVRFLLEEGAMLQKAKSTPYTALQAAAENGHMATVKLLLAAGADMHLRFEKLRATLKRASKKGFDDVADILLWHSFRTKNFGYEDFQWPVLCVPTKSRHTIVRDSIQKTQGSKNRKRRDVQSRIIPRISTNLTERPKDEYRA